MWRGAGKAVEWGWLCDGLLKVEEFAIFITRRVQIEGVRLLSARLDCGCIWIRECCELLHGRFPLKPRGLFIRVM